RRRASTSAASFGGGGLIESSSTGSGGRAIRRPGRRRRAGGVAPLGGGAPLGLAADSVLAVAEHVTDEPHCRLSVVRLDRLQELAVVGHRALVVALLVVVERAQAGDELREEVRHELVEQVRGRFAQQGVPAQVDLERALRIGAFGGLVVEQLARTRE